MRPADLAGRRVVVLGVGIDVAAALPAIAAARPAALDVVDAEPERAAAVLRDAGLADIAVHHDVSTAPDAEVAVRSPGFSPYQPAVQERIRRGLTTVTPLGLWLSERGPRPAVAITGTKGKSSTSVLTQLALERLGHPAVVLGNIGVPPWNHRPDMPETPVLEVSSYQAADLPVTAPVAALTAVGEDHVDWHGSVERYLADKARVFTAPTPTGGRWCGVPDQVVLPAAFADIDFRAVPAPPDNLRASNAHLAAATALASTDGDDDQLGDLAAELLDVYPDLPGRFFTVATIDGIAYIDDALASNPLGVAAALRALDERPVTVIVGGADRGASIDAVLVAIAERSSTTCVICIESAVALADRYRKAADLVEAASDLEAAVELAAATAAASGGVVLFAPGMPTPPAQGSWVDRSRRFRAAVDRLPIVDR